MIAAESHLQGKVALFDSEREEIRLA